ncbi:dihydroorotate dehydrogenase electron transfer subunit [Candidatus Aerophobetes bacterium]|nr:dihydroorotate dehydrogenase electron transfer subunit [Candidatus Aerophobetes bacterium]
MLHQQKIFSPAAENIRVKVLSNRCIKPGHFRLAFRVPVSFPEAVPGQFVHIKVGEGPVPLLRRPFSISNYTPGKIQIIYAVVGQGTKILSHAKRGDYLDMLGPAGKGFCICEEAKTHLLIGGGMGAAPLVFLARKILKKVKKDSSISVFLGFKTKQEIILKEEFAKNSIIGLQIATEDGSFGYRGLVSELFEDYLKKISSTSKFSIYACGPLQMLKTVARLSFDYDIFSQVSMEEIICCGVGACRGCVIKGTAGYMRVCQEGPVFDAKKISWS